MRYSTPPFPHEKNKPLAPFSTMGVGGAAHLFARAHDAQEMLLQVRFALEEEMPFYILGKGSNTVFDDRGFAGLVILNQIDSFEQKEEVFTVGSGMSFARLGQITAKRGFSGLEFAAGIPATVGGAVFMNAGANGQEVSQTLISVRFADRTLRVVEDFAFAYRSSIFHKLRGAIVEATFRLSPKEGVKQVQKEALEYRLQTQPYGEKSCGCAFRNPQGASAGELIDRCGLKGARRGGAVVSPLHGNFIVNQGGTASDVRALMAHIREKVHKETGYILEEEIRFIPYELPC